MKVPAPRRGVGTPYFGRELLQDGVLTLCRGQPTWKGRAYEDALLRLRDIRHDSFPLEPDSSVEQQSQAMRVELVFRLQDARRERVRAVLCQNRHRGLPDDGPAVHLGANEMHATPMQLDAGRQRACVGVQAREGRQQGWMDIDQAVVPARDEPGGEDAHEARLADELDASFLQPFAQDPLEGFSILEATMRQDLRANLCPRSSFQSLNIGYVGYHQRDLSGIVRCRGGVEKRLKIAAAPGNQHCDPPACHGARPSSRSPDPAAASTAPSG